MAYLANPNFGTLPGAPMRLNWWEGPQFRISDLLATLPPVSPPPPPTPQDTATQDAAIQLRNDTGGEGGNASGLDRSANQGGGITGTAGSTAGNTATPGSPDYAGTYGARAGPWGTTAAPPGSPAAYNSNYGGILGTTGMLAGTALGVPGVGMLGGIVGSNIDLHNYVDNLRAAGIAIAPDYLAASIAGALPSLPGTNIGQWLSEQLGIPSARSQSETARRDALANLSQANMFGATSIAPTQIDDVEKTILENPAVFGLANVGYQETPVAAFDPVSLGREAGYGGQFGVMGAPQGQTGYQSGTYQSGIPGGSADSQAGYGGAPSTGGGAVDTSGGGRGAGGGDTGRDTGFNYRGGLIGAPPGRYAAGGMIPQAPGDNISPAQFGALRGINPPGPDDQIGALQTGEGVIRKSQMQRYPGLLDAINSGRLDPKKVEGLLSPAPKARRR